MPATGWPWLPSCTAGRWPISGSARCPGPDLIIGADVTWTFASLPLDAVELGMGGAGGSYAGCRPALGLAWAFLTTCMGTTERAEVVERALLAAISAN